MFVNIPLNVKNTLRMVLSEEITRLQKGYTEVKLGLAARGSQVHPKHKAQYLKVIKQTKLRLCKLHNLNWWLKHPTVGTDNYMLVRPELQIILHYLRQYASGLYIDKSWINEDILVQKALAIDDGTLEHKIEFLRLNIFKNNSRKIQKKIQRIEEAIRVVKKYLNGTLAAKKPLSFKRRIRKFFYNLWR